MTIESQTKCISSGISLFRDYDSIKATAKSSIIFPENLAGLVRKEDWKIQHSELGMHLKAAGKDVFAFFLTKAGAYAIYGDNSGCGYIYGADTEVLAPGLLSKAREVFGPEG